MAYQALARRLKFLIESYARHGSGHVVEVFRQERIRRSYARAPEPLPALDRLAAEFDWSRSPGSLADDFYRAASTRLLFSKGNRKEFFLQLLQSAQSYDRILDDAEMIADGKFTALGVSIVEREGAFDWHRDYSSGRRWDPVPYNRISYLGGDGSDVKYVWELNRMYWIAWLGKAYWTTGNETWARAFTWLVDDWTASNPINVGVNWAMPMEVAIRGFWLTVGYSFFYGSRSIDTSWWNEYLRLVWGHGTYLERNLEYFSNLTNHYISNCFGLIALGAFFPGSARAARWLADGRRRLIEELDHQMLADGVHYERSICYHRLVLEMYLLSMALADRAGAPLPDEARRHIEAMAEFTLAYTPEHGTVPQLGDSDDGVILRLSSDQDLYDHRDTLSLAAALFGRSDFHAAAGRYSQAALLVAGSGPFERLQPAAPARRSQLFADGGFAVLRSPSLQVFADVGPIGLHGNNDTLSFTLHGPDGDMVIDPGTYCYTRDAALRNELRGTRAHDTPEVDGREIAEFDGPWRIKRDRTDPRIIHWEPSGDGGVLEAEHRAYADEPGVVVRRRWELKGDRLAVTDSFGGTGDHRVTTRFTVPAPWIVTALDGHRVEIAGRSTRLILEADVPLRLSDGWYSPGYGLAAKATCIQTERSSALPFQIAYLWALFEIPGRDD